MTRPDLAALLLLLSMCLGLTSGLDPSLVAAFEPSPEYFIQDFTRSRGELRHVRAGEKRLEGEGWEEEWRGGEREGEGEAGWREDEGERIEMLRRENSSALLSEEEFNSILRRFSLDALQAAQIADRLGLVNEFESPEELVNKYFGPNSDALTSESNQKPMAQALRMGNNPHRPRRGLTKAARRFFLGDQEMCYSGSCEFFLMCWLGGGLIEGGCGGFLYACCSRGDRGDGASYRAASQNYAPRNYGPIRNDPSE